MTRNSYRTRAIQIFKIFFFKLYIRIFRTPGPLQYHNKYNNRSMNYRRSLLFERHHRHYVKRTMAKIPIKKKKKPSLVYVVCIWKPFQSFVSNKVIFVLLLNFSYRPRVWSRPRVICFTGSRWIFSTGLWPAFFHATHCFITTSFWLVVRYHIIMDYHYFINGFRKHYDGVIMS